MTIDYWTFALEAATNEHGAAIQTMQESHEAEIEQIHAQNADLTDYMVADCEARLAEFDESFWEGPEDFRAISLAARGEQASVTHEDENESNKSNIAIAAIFCVLLITILGLICLVRDLQARLAAAQKTGQSLEVPAVQEFPLNETVEGRPAHLEHNSASKLKPAK